MKKAVAGVGKVFIPKVATVVAALFLFYSLPSWADNSQTILTGGLNAQNFNLCQETLQKECSNTAAQGDCFIKQLTNTQSCAQIQMLYGLTHMLAVAARNYDNIDVVQLKNLTLPQQINYAIIGKSGEIVLPQVNINLENAPGFLALKTVYPQAELLAQMMGYPEAVYLTENIQQLVFAQPLYNAASQKIVGYVKVLYTFTLDGQYKGQQAMRVVMYQG